MSALEAAKAKWESRQASERTALIRGPKTAATAVATAPQVADSIDPTVQAATEMPSAAGRRAAANAAAEEASGATAAAAAEVTADANGARISAHRPPAALSALRQELKSGERLKSHVRRIESLTYVRYG